MIILFTCSFKFFLYIKGQEQQATVYKCMKVLQMEINEMTFNESLNEFINRLALDPDLGEFLKYFQSNYVPIVNQWAMCHCIGVGINTNNYIEAFHGVFKMHYLNGKKTKECILVFMPY